MRKALTAAIMVAVLVSAGSAFAGPRMGHGHGHGYGYDGHFGYGPSYGPGYAQDIPQDVQQKINEMRTVQGQIREELTKEKPDAARARSLNETVIKLRRELSGYRLEQMLKNSGQDRGTAWRNSRGDSEIWTLRTEMFAELRKETVDTAKVRELYGKIESLAETQERACFEEILKSPSQYLNRMDGYGWHMGPHGRGRHFGPAGAGVRPGLGRAFSDADRAKFEQIRTLRDEMRSEMQKGQRDEAKLRELHKQIQVLEDQLSDQCFEEMLKAPVRVQ